MIDPKEIVSYAHQCAHVLTSQAVDFNDRRAAQLFLLEVCFPLIAGWVAQEEVLNEVSPAEAIENFKKYTSERLGKLLVNIEDHKRGQQS